MQCTEFEERLNAVLDVRGRPAADPRLAAHAAQCAGCRRLVAAHEALLAAVSDAEAPSLSADFSSRTVAVAVASRAPRAAAGFSRGRLALAGAIGSAAVVLLGLSILFGGRQAGSPAARGGGPLPEALAAGRGHVVGLAIAHAPTGHQLPRHSTPSMTGADVFLSAPSFPDQLLSYRGAIGELSFTLPEAAIRLEEVERLAPGIRPLRASFSVIWDTLCRTIPGARESDPKPRERTSHRLTEAIQIA